MSAQLPLVSARATPLTPWEEVRAKNPGAPLARVILLDKGMQFFVRINPSRPGIAMLEDATFIHPKPEDEAAHQAIIRAYDAAWIAQREAA